ncbi:MAG: hypothetical protein LBI77_00580 [Puniceicoccales bacterium]|nr:hypothetical protein [Puniceicoccales bacterium]
MATGFSEVIALNRASNRVEGDTQLHLAVRDLAMKNLTQTLKETKFKTREEKLSFILTLIGEGADVNAKNSKAETPLDVAYEIKQEQEEVASLFKGEESLPTESSISSDLISPKITVNPEQEGLGKIRNLIQILEKVGGKRGSKNVEEL